MNKHFYIEFCVYRIRPFDDFNNTMYNMTTQCIVFFARSIKYGYNVTAFFNSIDIIVVILSTVNHPHSSLYLSTY